MPEGHVIHRLATHLSERFKDAPVHVDSPQGRFAVEAQHFDGAVLVGAEALGKHLFLEFDVPEPRWIHIHLGLIGKLRIEPASELRGQIRLRITDGVTEALLSGPQWCRGVTTAERDEVVAASGPDPLREDADPEVGFRRLTRSGKSVAALLMDQRIAAGVGNIFRAEVLYRQHLRPTTPGREIDRRTWMAVWEDLVTIMHAAVAAGRIDTVVDEHSPAAQDRLPREDRHGGEVYVYRRAGQPCLVCGREVRTSVLEGRNLYWCPGCQNRKRVARR
ncbi:Fpg/Nei family DNA glycosylase [Tessaracoccus antarcticus]|uniref:DNA-(apurinic or apyrimidinic site) lyase n=1 Tax=Tessaracoccus antarcticus TaxID=2479848 RepID=A0A3M0G5G3_9ACTN|nr:DNA-formamidopyrimidine glycosylase family protein [Tessaracoccus antarcticus]RMB57492.1 Fpg/Nei family DNA glycosylase [Tessaracoccus antarcticus]